MDKILLIDLHNALHRANISFGLSNHKLDQNKITHCICGAIWSSDFESCSEDYVMIYNFFRNFRPIIEQFAPDKCFCVMEGHPQFRYNLFPEYKANRIIKTGSFKQSKKNKFFQDKDIIVGLLKNFPITLVRSAAYEADDLIYTFCQDLKDEKLTILSNDSDFIQLLQKGYQSIQIYNPIKKEFMLAPSYHYVAAKCILGDKSDNIPALLTKNKAMKVINDSILFEEFLSQEENRARFNINKQLIEFRLVPLEEIEIIEGIRNFESVKEAFKIMKFESIINDKSWENFTKTFNCLKF